MERHKTQLDIYNYHYHYAMYKLEINTGHFYS